MADVTLLELTNKFILQHQQHSDIGPTQVIPVIHDSIEMDYDVLGAIVRRYDGTYLRCDDVEPSPKEVRGPINQAMANHLIELCEKRNMRIGIFERENQIEAIAQGYGEPTGSLPMVLRMLAMLASAELNAPLVVLSYDLAKLDEVRAALLWEAALAPARFAPPLLRTFVPIAGGDVDVPAHCNRQEGAVRLVVRNGEVIERATSRAMEDSLRMILTSVDQPIVLFLGAGASASSLIPQGNRVRDLALASLINREVGSPDLIHGFREWLTERGRWMTDERHLPLDMFERNLTLERVLREEFFALSGRDRNNSITLQRMARDCTRALDRRPPGRQALWELAGALPRLIIATVNFDQQIEIGMGTEHRVVVTRDEFVEHRDLVVARLSGESTLLPIIKLHGSIDNFETLVVDITSTSRGLPPAMTSMLDAMLGAAPYLTWVWVGCSMRDADIGVWLAGKSGARGKDLQEWWVDPLPPKSVYEYARRWRLREWAEMDQDLKDRQITEASDRFFSAFALYTRDAARTGLTLGPDDGT